MIEALEFGLEVEREWKPYDIIENVFHRLHRRNPQRWKSTRSMYRLWREYQANQRRRAWLAVQIKELIEIRQGVGGPDGYLVDSAIRMATWWLDQINDPRKLANQLDEERRHVH
ncbi:hypothetical protein [Bradyrhizobium sp. JYMT SZCCT0428]|uniref:hypothetical protein n=1 Tax=Bradyrhizobium sp. JYMT SZCCT0428 TaxID=2807673 RepID=UPI001BAE09EC|nr:hypothetical protein [Bradyrhizobium sp. JYMT SZCCT0428]MBR1153568.1 hypothetical protein [Bradyrhizobium sp. JYMT SZCCT0428]